MHILPKQIWAWISKAKLPTNPKPLIFWSLWNEEQPVPGYGWGWELFTQFHVTQNLNLCSSVNVLISNDHYVYIKSALIKITNIFRVFHKLEIHLITWRITSNYKMIAPIRKTGSVPNSNQRRLRWSQWHNLNEEYRGFPAKTFIPHLPFRKFKNQIRNHIHILSCLLFPMCHPSCGGRCNQNKPGKF